MFKLKPETVERNSSSSIGPQARIEPLSCLLHYATIEVPDNSKRNLCPRGIPPRIERQYFCKSLFTRFQIS